MAEYINREDAEMALLERCKETGYGGLTPDDIRLVMRTPWRIPTADVVEVVRCKDCAWCHAGYCETYDDLIPFGCANKPWEDWFCADGKR